MDRQGKMRIPAGALIRAMSVRCRPASFERESVKSILVLRMNRIGDMICAIPLIKTLRSEFPDASITVLADSRNAEIIKYEPYIDRIIVYKRPSGLFRSRILNIMKALDGADFDIAIGVKGGFSSFLAIAAVLSGARFRIGYVSRNKLLLNRFFNLPVEPIDFGITHQVDACLNLLNPLGVKEAIKDITLSIPSGYKDTALAFLKSKGLKPKERLVIFNISNNRESSTWASEKIIGLAAYFSKTYKCRFIISGLPEHESRAVNICNGIGPGAFFIRTISIMDFAAITSFCNVLVTGDGGASHAGAAAGALVITLLGAAPPEIWRPYGEQHISLKASDSDVNSITVEEVCEAIQAKGIESYL
jgi:heptosyltransferase III